MLPTLGKYRLIAELGRGGMADVLLAASDAQHVDFTKLVVLKKLRQELAQDIEFVTMFMDEARIAARLNHPNVIQTIEVGQEEDDFFLAMEYLDGQPLRRIVRRVPEGLDRAIHLTILCEMLSGLHYAHELKDYDGSMLNIVHRDVTPHNIFVTYDGQVKVVDFGIAKAAGRAAETRHGVIKGKIAYMAPEQVSPVKDIDRRVDVFAAGVMIYEAAIRGRFWAGVKENDILYSLLAGEWSRSPREKEPAIPEALDKICQRALAQNPDDRYPTAAALQSDLEDYISEFEKRPSPRRTGGYVASLFAEERESARQIIQDQLADLVGSKKTLVMLPLGADPVSTSNDVNLKAEVTQGAEEVFHGANEGKSDDRRKAMAAPTIKPPAQRRAAVSARLIALVLIALAAVVAAGLALRRVVAAGHAAADATAVVHVHLYASPEAARLQIDDGPARPSPYLSEFPRDSIKHQVRVFAPGFAEKVEMITFDRDVSMHFVLSKTNQP